MVATTTSGISITNAMIITSRVAIVTAVMAIEIIIAVKDVIAIDRGLKNEILNPVVLAAIADGRPCR